MRRDKSAELNRSQKSVQYAPETPKDSGFHNAGLYAHMLIEDIRLSVVPVGGRTTKKTFEVQFSPLGKDSESFIAQALDIDGYRSDITSSVCRFIGDCAASLLCYRELVYEIVYLTKPENNAVAGFELIQLPPGTFYKRGSHVTQYIPTQLASRLNKPTYVDLPSADIMVFEAPPLVRGELSPMMETLSHLSAHTVPDFVQKELISGMTSGVMSTAYDARTHINSRVLALAEATRLIGWNARGMFEEYLLEYYQLHRRLLFERFKIIFRNSILKTLNEGIRRAGSKVGFQGQLELKGLPGLDDVTKAQRALTSGSLPFKQILEPFSGF